MKETKLLIEGCKKIIINVSNTKAVAEKQINFFGKRIFNEVIRYFSDIDEDILEDIFERNLYSKLNEEINALFTYYQTQEINFYCKNLKTVDRIFNTLSDKRTQTIYLENFMKKINLNDYELDSLFNESFKSKIPVTETNTVETSLDSENSHSIDSIVNRFVQGLIKTCKLSVDEAETFNNMVTRDYELYRNDLLKILNQLFIDNKVDSITLIEREMDNREIRNGKTSAMAKMEKAIMSNSLSVMEKILKDIIVKHKDIAKEELKVCSSLVVDLIFKQLGDKYEDQRDILEVIVDTSINERLGILLEEEVQKLYNNLLDKNNDKIKNELYEEKRYKEINDYECNLSLVDKVYQAVLNEIRLAYDIPIRDANILALKVLGEGTSTKMVFQKLRNNIIAENSKNLENVCNEMRILSKNAGLNASVNNDEAPKR